MNRFEGKSVIVTGAASGFGTAIARKFANEGAQIICADLNMAGASELASELANAVPFEIDVANEQQNKDMIACAVDHFGKIDVLCCNAGIPHKGNYMIRMPVEDFDKMWAVNVRSIFLAARAAVPHMPPGSSIISTASIGGKRPRPGLVPYNASKAA
ncbi:SDR family NAD(P)-dependent oxidoreductase, partial [Pseudomonadales bacterium]|nr:SDR family NAD(P)-dependent oxidoreductase [Pseudomonadales bacterium]